MSSTPLRIAVTRGNGKLSRATVAGLRAAGHTVTVLDMADPDRSQLPTLTSSTTAKW